MYVLFFDVPAFLKLKTEGKEGWHTIVQSSNFAMQFEIIAMRCEIIAMRFEIIAMRFEIIAMLFEIIAMRFKMNRHVIDFFWYLNTSHGD